MRTINILLMIVVVAVCQQITAQGLPDTTFFDAHVYIQDSDTLQYRLYCSDSANAAIEKTTAQPLVVFLHGAGERGNNNVDQLRHCVRFFLNDTVCKRYPFYLLVPQCPENRRWVNTDWTLPSHVMDEQPTIEMRCLLSLIDSLVEYGIVDKRRVYICGISMGGFGVWDALSRRPDLFAAAIPVCGGGDTTQAIKMRNIPIQIFHGKKDNLVKFSRSVDMFNALNRLNSKHLFFTKYEFIGHGCWDKAFSTPGLFEWLFKQVKDEE